MKKCKSVPVLILIFILMFNFSVSASAVDIRFQATKDYMNALMQLNGADFEPSDLAVIGDTLLGDREVEIVTVYYDGNLSDYAFGIIACISEDYSNIILQTTVLEFDEEKLADVLAAVNDFNASTTGVKLFADPSDNTVIAEMYQNTTESSFPELSLNTTAQFISLVDVMVDRLAQYAA